MPRLAPPAVDINPPEAGASSPQRTAGDGARGGGGSRCQQLSLSVCSIAFQSLELQGCNEGPPLDPCVDRAWGTWSRPSHFQSLLACFRYQFEPNSVFELQPPPPPGVGCGLATLGRGGSTPVLIVAAPLPISGFLRATSWPEDASRARCAFDCWSSYSFSAFSRLQAHCSTTPSTSAGPSTPTCPTATSPRPTTGVSGHALAQPAGLLLWLLL